MTRRRLTVGALALLLLAISAQSSGPQFKVNVDFAGSGTSRQVAKAEAAVKVGGASLLINWTKAALR